MKTPDQWPTYQDLAAQFQVHPRTVKRWLARWRISVFRPTQRTVRVAPDDIARMVHAATLPRDER
jgi:DNA-binding transcriptional regulator YhcF (GntR family)